jgi:hypothetical protein
VIEGAVTEGVPPAVIEEDEPQPRPLSGVSPASNTR